MPITKRTMYPPQKDSPTTFLSGDISAASTTMTVASVSSLPTTVPFPLTLGIDKSITETVIVTNVNETTRALTITRLAGAMTWTAGTQCARIFNAADLLAVQQNLSDAIDFTNTMEGDVSDFDERIDGLEMTVGGSSSGLVKGLADEIIRATSAEDVERTRAQNAESALDTAKPNRTELAQLIVDWVYSQDATKVLLTISRYNANTQQTTQFTKTLPIASAIAMGVMPPEVYNEVTSLRSAVTALQQQGGRFINQSFATLSALKGYSVPATVHVGDFAYVLDDENHQNGTTKWIYNGQTGTTTTNQTSNGFAFGYIIEYDPVGIADSNTLGLVKSDAGTTNGKIFVEVNGTMSLIGWDTLNTSVNGKLDKAGGTMTGALVLSSDPSANLGAATKQYVDDNKTPRMPFFGICATAAATTAKTVSISDFAAANLVTGAFVVVAFTSGNSVTTPTLNISTTGAKTIRYRNTALQANMITENTWCVFEYDGTYWQLLNPDSRSLAEAALPKSGGTMTGDLVLNANPTVNLGAATKQYVDNNKTPQKIFYGVCNTIAATAAKTVSISGFTAANLVADTFAVITFTNAIETSTATLDINSTGATTIKYKNDDIGASHIGELSSALFVHDGTVWQLLVYDLSDTIISLHDEMDYGLDLKLSKSGGTMTGDLITNNPDVITSAARNIYAGTATMTAGTSDLTTGAIYLQYE